MPGYRLLAAMMAALCVLAFACNGDDDGDKQSPTPTARETPSGTGETATPPDDKYTPVDETPEVTEPPANTPTAPPPASEGTPAIAPDDQSAYVVQFLGREVKEEMCAYNPSTRVTDCSQRGRYAIDPPLTGQDISCSIGLVDGQPEYIRCSSIDPQQNRYYEIRV